MDALERAKKRLLGESQVASGPSQALGPDAPPDDDRMAQARARLEQEPPTNFCANKTRRCSCRRHCKSSGR